MNNNKFLKAKFGEKLLYQWLLQQEYVIYSPNSGVAHKVDCFFQDWKKQFIYGADAKCKRRMYDKPSTGIPYKNYLKYRELLEKNKIDVFLFFVDDFEGAIYGQWISKLGDPQELGRFDVVFWNLDQMQFIRWLSNDEIDKISLLTESKHSFKSVPKYWECKAKQLDLFY